MVTHTQKMEVEGTTFAAGGDRPQGERMQPARNGVSKFWGRIAIFSLILLALGLSVAFPYGIGLVVFVWGIALVGALVGAGLMCFNLVKELFGKTATFGYSPATAYMAGKKTKKRRKEESADGKKDMR